MRPEHYLNAVLSLFVAGALSYIVFAEHIKEGPIVKLGLICTIAGLLATAVLILYPQDDYDQAFWEGLWNAGLLTRIGMAVIIVGYWLRRLYKKHPMLRVTDWQTLE